LYICLTTINTYSCRKQSDFSLFNSFNTTVKFRK